MAVLAALGTVVLIVFLLWFAIGTQRNISRGNDLLRWLQGGLGQLGDKTTLRWFGSSAVQLDIATARSPFTSAQINVVLEPRDLGWLWAWARQQGRRDFLILRGTLPDPPKVEVEAGGDRGWTGKDKIDRLDLAAWSHSSWSDDAGTVDAAHSDAADIEALQDAWAKLTAASEEVWRVSIRNLEPHVEVHVVPPKPDGSSAANLIAAFRALGEIAPSRGT